jgi:hypothetical protein
MKLHNVLIILGMTVITQSAFSQDTTTYHSR